jgi:calcium/calmodulin-dependent protein kinase (CaM kinase) II
MNRSGVVRICALLAVGALSYWCCLPASASADATQEVLDVVRQFQSAGIRGDRSVLSQIFDANVTHFHPGAPYRFTGRDRLIQEFEAASKTQVDMRFEMVDPQVQMASTDTAIATYYIVESWADKTGVRTTAKEKATEVYVKKDGRWQMIHSHYSLE